MAVTINGNGVVTGLDSEGSSDLGTELEAAGGLVMVTPTTIANSGGTATLTAGAVAFSGVTSLSLNGVFTTTYDNYRIMWDATCSTNNNVNARMRVGGVDETGSNYVNQYLLASATTVAANRATTTSFPFGDLTTTIRAAAQIEIFSPRIAQPTNFLVTGQYSSASAALIFYAGTHSLSTAYDGFTISPNTGTWTGTLRVYGYRNGI
jgi:hypothetical protein